MDNNLSKTKLSKLDIPLTVGFCLLSILLVVLAFTNKEFFDWAFARHQNQLSWYIRPLFLLPFCFFSYKRYLAGITGTMFLLLTSMFWFPEPSVIDKSVREFLDMEKQYLTSDWNWPKVVITILVPLSLIILSVAFWKKNRLLGIWVLVFIAVAKMLWSFMFGGESGQTVILPAVIGLVLCILIITIVFARINRKKRSEPASDSNNTRLEKCE